MTQAPPSDATVGPAAPRERKRRRKSWEPTALHVFVGGDGGDSFGVTREGGRLVYKHLTFGFELHRTLEITSDRVAWQAFWYALDAISSGSGKRATRTPRASWTEPPGA